MLARSFDRRGLTIFHRRVPFPVLSRAAGIPAQRDSSLLPSPNRIPFPSHWSLHQASPQTEKPGCRADCGLARAMI